MESIAPAHVDSPFHFSIQSSNETSNQLIDLDKVSIGYTETPVLEKITLRIMPGSRLGLLGPNGAGKSTLIKLFAGLLKPKQGESTLGEGLQIGYFAQHQSLRQFLGGFGFIGDMALAPVAPFSGGEKARLALALLIWQRPNVLLLDEPTNHLDLEMRHALTLALMDYSGALVIVSHDRHLLRTTTDQLLLVANGRVKTFEGDLADYRQWLFEHRAEQRQTSPQIQTITRSERKRLDAQQREQRRPLQNRLKKVEKELDKLTAEKAVLEKLLADPNTYDNNAQVKEYIQQQTTLTKQLQQTEEKWLEITEALENLAS